LLSPLLPAPPPKWDREKKSTEGETFRLRQFNKITKEILTITLIM